MLPSEHPWLAKMRQEQGEILTNILNSQKRSTANFHQQTLQKLADLKQNYIQNYMALHTSARLGVNEDKLKNQLVQDVRSQSLQKLTTIDLMPASQLRDWQNTLASLRTCATLTEQELQATPTCPHCQFKPGSEKSLLREFEEYRQSKQKKLKVFRLEAVRAGFAKAWREKNYQILTNGALRKP